MNTGLVTFGVVALIVGLGMLVLNDVYLEEQVGEQVPATIPGWFVWLVTIAGAGMIIAGYAYGPVAREAKRRY